MKTFLNTIMLVVGTAFSAVLLWAFLYLCIPSLKDNTDKLFKWNDYKVVESEAESETPKTEGAFKFENDFATITLG